MAVSVASAAKRLAQKSGWTLSNLQLQKILYLAHMMHLGQTGEPLVRGHFEAWDYGPVHPDLYHKVKVFGSGQVQNIFHNTPDMESGAEREIIDDAYDSLGNIAPGQLVNATHRKNGAWDKNYIPGVRHCLIPNEDILEEFRRLRDESERQ